MSESCCSSTPAPTSRLRAFIDQAKKYEPLRTGVVYPCDQVSLQGAAEAAAEGLIMPVLVGPSALIRAAAEAAKIDISSYEIVEAATAPEAAALAVSLAREGKVAALMKGSLHTDEYMGAVVNKEKGLRVGRRLSHCFVIDVPTYKFPFLLTDGALNIAPDLAVKKDIIQNAIYMAHDVGIEKPKVAVLAAAETISYAMQATMDAAILAKMGDRGQITGAIIDGPLAFDNAVSMEAAKIKKITSPVAGDADILVVPNIEAGNMVFKELVYMANATAFGIVIGAKVPLILTSRADSAQARIASAALAVLSVAGDRARANKK